MCPLPGRSPSVTGFPSPLDSGFRRSDEPGGYFHSNWCIYTIREFQRDNVSANNGLARSALRLTCGFILGLVVGVVAILAALMLREPPETPVVTEAIPGEPDITIFISEDYLTEEVAIQLEALRDDGVVQIKNLRIDAQQQNIVEISGDAIVTSKITVPFRLSVRPYADNGLLHVDVVSTNVGSLLMPEGVNDLDAEVINPQLDAVLAYLPLKLLDISADDKGIYLDLELNPNAFTFR